MSIGKIVAAALEKDAVSLKESLSEILSERIALALEEKMSELQELSKEKLSKYIDKASDQLDKDWQDTRKGKPGLSQDKVANRFQGLYTAQKRKASGYDAKTTNEEVDQLDEISKQTLVNYMDKSKKDSKVLQKKYNDDKITPDEEKRMDRRTFGQIKALDKFHGRAKVPASGKDKAYDMAQKALRKEDINQLDELSKDTLASYIKKVPADATRLKFKAINHTKKAFDNWDGAEHEEMAAKLHHKYDNRIKGAAKAVDRLVKEEKFNPVKPLVRSISFNDFEHHVGDEDYAAVKKIKWPYGVDVKYNDRTRTVTFKTAKMATVAALLDQNIDMGSINAGELLDLPTELFRSYKDKMDPYWRKNNLH